MQYGRNEPNGRGQRRAAVRRGRPKGRRLGDGVPTPHRFTPALTMISLPSRTCLSKGAGSGVAWSDPWVALKIITISKNCQG